MRFDNKRLKKIVSRLSKKKPFQRNISVKNNETSFNPEVVEAIIDVNKALQENKLSTNEQDKLAIILTKKFTQLDILQDYAFNNRDIDAYCKVSKEAQSNLDVILKYQYIRPENEILEDIQIADEVINLNIQYIPTKEENEEQPTLLN